MSQKKPEVFNCNWKNNCPYHCAQIKILFFEEWNRLLIHDKFAAADYKIDLIVQEQYKESVSYATASNRSANCLNQVRNKT